jgi:hypothetical protein
MSRKGEKEKGMKGGDIQWELGRLNRGSQSTIMGWIKQMGGLLRRLLGKIM